MAVIEYESVRLPASTSTPSWFASGSVRLGIAVGTPGVCSRASRRSRGTDMNSATRTRGASRIGSRQFQALRQGNIVRAHSGQLRADHHINSRPLSTVRARPVRRTRSPPTRPEISPPRRDACRARMACRGSRSSKGRGSNGRSLRPDLRQPRRTTRSSATRSRARGHLIVR